MKCLKYALLAGALFLKGPNVVNAYQTEIKDGEVVIQNIVKHFNGELNLEKDDNGVYYSEYIFDGKNVTIHSGESFIWINGEAQPYKTLISEGVLLPQHHVITKIWDETWVPVDLFIREFGYEQVNNKLLYDIPLGATVPTVDKNKEDQKEKPVVDNNPTDASNNNIKTEPVTETAEEQIKVPSEDISQNGKPNVNSNQEDKVEEVGNDQEIEDPVEEKEDNKKEDKEENDILEENTLSLLGQKYKIGKHFSLKSSYPDRQKYISEGNILTSWYDLRVDARKATLILGQGNTTFKDLQGKLSMGDTMNIVDAAKNQRTYSIVDKIQSSLMDTEKVHNELYGTYQGINSIILQFQEEDKMSFYIAT